jgi:uncharacterized membrane protein YdcZ (DUF606 family)
MTRVLCKGTFLWPLGAALEQGGVMPEWIWIVGLIVAWVVINRWVLPRLGVKT